MVYIFTNKNAGPDNKPEVDNEGGEHQGDEAKTPVEIIIRKGMRPRHLQLNNIFATWGCKLGFWIETQQLN